MSYAPLMGDSNMRFQTTWLLISAVSLGVLLQACEPDTPIAVDDGGVADANVDGCVIVECAAPPMGCRYEGGDPCTSCGAIVCPDAAVATVCEACPGTVVAGNCTAGNPPLNVSRGTIRSSVPNPISTKSGA